MSHARQRRIFEEASNWWFLVRAPLRALWIVCENGIGVVFYVCALIICRPISYFAPNLYWKCDEFLVWMGMWYVSFWMRAACEKLMVYGEDLEPYGNEPCLVLVNHQSDADPLILMVALRKLEQLRGKLSVVLEDIFHWTHFGIMMRLRGDVFIHQGREKRHLQAALIEEHIRRYEHLRAPRWCILFPEGGFLKKRKQRNMDYAKKHGYPILENVLLPRLGAAQALLNASPNDASMNHLVKNGDAFHHSPKRYFRHIIDVTVAYPDGKPVSLSKMLLAVSPVSHVAVHFRVKKIDHLSAFDEEQLRKFMYELWLEKDQLLRNYYENGYFPDLRIEDTLEIRYMSYVKGYFLAVPVLSFYAFCAWTCLNYTWWLVTWFFQSLISLAR